MTAHPFGATHPHDVIRVKPRPSLAAQLDADARREERLAAMFPLARQIVDAASHGRRATIVLQISDEIVLAHFAALTDALVEAGFDDGRLYLLERYAALLEVRDPYGKHRDVVRLEMLRRGLAAIAHGSAA